MINLSSALRNSTYYDDFGYIGLNIGGLKCSQTWDELKGNKDLVQMC